MLMMKGKIISQQALPECSPFQRMSELTTEWLLKTAQMNKSCYFSCRQIAEASWLMQVTIKAEGVLRLFFLPVIFLLCLIYKAVNS